MKFKKGNKLDGKTKGSCNKVNSLLEIDFLYV